MRPVLRRGRHGNQQWWVWMLAVGMVGAASFVSVLTWSAGVSTRTSGSAGDLASALAEHGLHGVASDASGGAKVGLGMANLDISVATQGRVFHAARLRAAPPMDFDSVGLGIRDSRSTAPNQLVCERWAVITTIFEPTLLIEQIQRLKDWCLVIVGDKKSPKEYPINPNRAVYLSPEAQNELKLRVSSELQWNHFGRKNVGFLYAVWHGAKIVYDTDDDNILISEEIPVLRPETRAFELEHSPGATSAAVNIYKLFSQSTSWPRGFPLDHINDPAATPRIARHTTLKKAQVIQSLANHDPDVDALYRLTRALPLNFDPAIDQDAVVLPQRGMLSPWNAQATLFRKDALWAMLLPTSVHGRVSDIWRSYLVQRVMWDTDGRLAFTSPFVKQCRNAHNYLADLDAESDLYKKAGELARILAAWVPTAKTVSGRLLEGAVLMYEHLFLELSDISLFKAWIEDLHSFGYEFPPITASHWVAESGVTTPDASLHVEDSSCEQTAVERDPCAIPALNVSFFGPRTINSVSKVVAKDVDIRTLKFLVLDAHMAPQVETLGSLGLDFGVPPSNIAALCVVNYCHRMTDIAERFAQLSLGKHKREVRSWARDSYVKRRMIVPPQQVVEAINAFDVIVCGFPSWQCIDLIDSGKVIVLRFAHSAWHALSSEPAQRWLNVLKELHDNPRVVVTSNNPFHFLEYKHAVGRSPLPWAATYSHIRGEENLSYDPQHQDSKDSWVLDIGSAYDPVTDSVRKTIDAIVNETAQTDPDSVRWTFVDFKPLVNPVEQRHKVSLAVVFPYAPHTAKITEMYALGVPMLMPSIKLLMEDEARGIEVMKHRDGTPNPDGEGICPVPDYSPKMSINRASSQDRVRSIQYWMRASEFYMWPHIFFYDSRHPKDLMKTIDQVMADLGERQRRSRGMVDFFDKVRGQVSSAYNGRAEVQLAIERAAHAAGL